jgi:hypothetical protein
MSLQSLTAHVNYSTFPRRRSIPCPFAYSLREESLAGKIKRVQTIFQHHLTFSTGKNAYRTAFANPESHADLALKSAYELRSVEHILKLRHGSNPTPQRVGVGPFANFLTANAVHTPTYRNPMPLLTLRGFIDSTAMEVLTNPSQRWTYLNRALHYYQIQIWREKYDIPREMIPMITPPTIQARQN